jgi:hypothetical protein
MRFGLYFVDYNSADRPRYPKSSAGWYANYVHTHSSGPVLPAAAPLSAASWNPLSTLREIFQDRNKFFLFGHFFIAP